MNSIALLIVSLTIIALIHYVFKAKTNAVENRHLLQSVIMTIVFYGLIVLGVVWIINMMIMVPEIILLPRT